MTQNASPTPPRKIAIFSLSNKGGAGKTLKTTAMVDVLRNEMAKPTLPIDLDKDNKSLCSVYARHNESDVYDHAANQEAALEDVPSGALLFDVSKDSSLTELGNTLVENHISWIYALIDYRAGNQDQLKNMLGSLAGFAKFLMKRDIDVVLSYVVDHDPASAAGVAETICNWGAGPRLILVKNVREAKHEGRPFEWYDGSLGSGAMSPREAVRIAGGVEVDMPLFLGEESILAKARREHKPLSELNLSPVDESRVQSFLDDFGTAFLEGLESVMSRPGITPAAIKQIKAGMAPSAAGAGK